MTPTRLAFLFLIVWWLRHGLGWPVPLPIPHSDPPPLNTGTTGPGAGDVPPAPPGSGCPDGNC